MDFYKYHGLGNDYIVIDPSKTKVAMNEKNIKAICRRHFGVGSDGILYGPIFDNGKINFKIYNSDGSEAEKSGNGIRIFAKYLVDEGYVLQDNFDLYTLSGKVSVNVLDKEKNLFRVFMGGYTFSSSKIPVTGEEREVLGENLKVRDKEFKINCVNVGNPHCVIVLDEISAELTKEYGPYIENASIFPNRTNVHFAKVINDSKIEIEIWERGSGYTLASGTCSIGSALVCNKLRLVSNKVEVVMREGSFLVEINEDGVYLTGVAEKVFDGNFSKELSLS